MIKRILIIALLYSMAAPVAAVGGTSFDPSLTPFTARQVGMGGVAVGFANDANGIFSNPAGMVELEFPQLVATSRKLVLDETQYSLIGAAIPTDYGTFGFGYVTMGTGGSLPTQLDPGTNRIIIDPTREAMSYDNSVAAISYANKAKIPQLPNKIAYGGNLKFFSQGLSGDFTSKASGMGLDLAASYQAKPWLTVGANLQNLLEGTMQWDGGASDKIGGNYKLGCKVNVLGSSKEALYQYPQTLHAGLDIDVSHSTLTSTNYHLGFEYFPYEKVALRSGFNLEQDNLGFTLGIGLINGGFRFDYAFAQRPGIPGDTPHYFSLSYVGARSVSQVRAKAPKRKESRVKFIKPKDRSITDADTIVISAEARAALIYDLTTIWRVIAISETREVKEVRELEDLKPVYLNGIKLNQTGSISATSPLAIGRNVFQLVGYTSPKVMLKKGTPEVFTASGEAKVLRFVPFSDTPMDYWAIRPIALSVTLGLVKGYPDDTFRPERGITRAELVTLLVRSMSDINPEAEIAATPFTDVDSSHWGAKYIMIGSRKNLITGYPDGSFKPSRVLTRAEGVTILTRYSGLVGEEQKASPFPDVKPDYWAAKYIGPAKELGLLKYLEGKDFEPSKPFPRAEAAEVLYRTPNIQKRVDQYWETGTISEQ
jgi:hypothetical protein